MLRNRFIAIGATLLALSSLSTASFAQTQEDMSFDGMMKMVMVDKNKDGMVSKQEFLDTMSKVWDMKAKQMKVSGDKMTPDDFKQILMYLKAGS
jgi:hypothetical protein